MAPSASSTRSSHRTSQLVSIGVVREILKIEDQKRFIQLRDDLYSRLSSYRDHKGKPLYRANLAWCSNESDLDQLAVAFLDEDQNGARYWPDEPSQPLYSGLKYSESRKRIRRYVKQLLFHLHNNRYKSYKTKDQEGHANRNLGLTQDNAIPINDADDADDRSGLHLSTSGVVGSKKRRKRRMNLFPVPPERRSSRERQPITDPDRATDAEIEEATRLTRSLSPIPSVEDARQQPISAQEANSLDDAVDIAMDQTVAEDTSEATNDASAGQEIVPHFVRRSHPPVPEAAMAPSTNPGTPTTSNSRINDLDGLYPVSRFRPVPNQAPEESPSSRNDATFRPMVEDAPDSEADDIRARFSPSPTGTLAGEQELRRQRDGPIPATVPLRPGGASMLPPPIPPARRSRLTLTFYVIRSRSPCYLAGSWTPSKNFNSMSLSELEAEVPLRGPASSKGMLFTLKGPNMKVSMKVSRGKKGEHIAMLQRFEELINNKRSEIRGEHLIFSIDIEGLLDAQSSIDHMEVSNDDDYDGNSVWGSSG